MTGVLLALPRCRCPQHLHVSEVCIWYLEVSHGGAHEASNIQVRMHSPFSTLKPWVEGCEAHYDASNS